MPTSEQPPIPEWVSTDSVPNGGLDLTGLRLPVLTIGTHLLDGITTVTPIVRYLSFQAWIVSSYIHARLPDSREHFQDFASKVESAIAIGNLINQPSMTGVVGALAAGTLARTSTETVEFNRLVKQLATTIYLNPSIQLNFLLQGSSVPGLSVERGEALATCVRAAMAISELGVRFTNGELVESASRSQIQSFGTAADLSHAPEQELELLISGIIPQTPQPAERNRVLTYMALLGLAGKTQGLPTADDFFAETGAINRMSHPSLHRHLDHWLRHLVRDSLAVAHEHVLQEALRILADLSQGVRMISRVALADALCKDTHADEETLRAIDLLEPAEAISTLTFRQLFERIRAVVTSQDVIEEGLRRWAGQLSELTLIELISAVPAKAAVLLPVVWCLAFLRAEHWTESDERPFEGRLGFGWDLIGVCAVIIPDTRKFVQEDWSMTDVMKELALRTVEQHLRVSWSRMASDPQHDVAMLIADGDEWISRNEKHVREYTGGRTDSRIDQAIGWLEQLNLIDSHGRTARGEQLYSDLCSSHGVEVM